MSKNKTNPALRFYETIELARSKANQGGSLFQLWAKLFDIKGKPSEPRYVVEVFSKLTELQSQFQWTLNNAVKLNLAESLHWASDLDVVGRVVFNLAQTNAAELLTKQITDAHMVSIRGCVYRLLDIEHETLIDESEVTKLKTDLNDLFEHINSMSSLDADVKRTIMELLETSRQLMAGYDIRGSDALNEILERAIGRLILIKKDLAGSDESKEVLKSVWGWLAKVGAAYGTAKSVKNLLSDVSKLLGIDIDS